MKLHSCLEKKEPRLLESLQILAEILHPEAFEPTLEGVAWQGLLVPQGRHRANS